MSLNTILATTPLTSTGYHLKATGTTIGNSLIWDNGTNVGIGNTNTSYTLDVTGSGRYNNASAMALTVNGGTFTQATASSYSLGVGNTGGFDLTLGTSTTAGVIQTWSSKPLSLNPQGNNVLIGSTTDSSYKLDVTGTVRFSSTLLVSGAATFSSTIGAGGTITIPSDVSGTSGYKINYTSADAGSRSWKIANDSSAYGDFVIQQSTTQSGSTYVNKFIINPSGDVGINETSANIYAKMQVTATSGATFALANPSAAAAGGGSSIWFYGTTGYNTQGVISTGYDGTSVTAAYMSFFTRGPSTTERIRITSGGYVGIGVINPITKLSVAGSIAMGNNTDGITNLSYGGKISAKQTQVTGGAGATLIHRGLGSVGYFILVSGIGGPSNTYRFTDLIYGTGSNTPAALASSTVGSAPTRTYSISGENLYVALSGGDTYTVTTTGLGAMES